LISLTIARILLHIPSQLFYTEVWAHNTVELLDCLCNGSVTYSDARGGGSDVFGRAGLAEMIGDCCASHPLLHIEVVGDLARGVPPMIACQHACVHAGKRGCAVGAILMQIPPRPLLEDAIRVGRVAHPIGAPRVQQAPRTPSPSSLQDDISLDATGSSATCEWHATAADLLPSRSGAPPTGLVSEVCGCDQLTFGPDGRIRAILSFRDRFAEEEAVAEAEAETDADDY
jgi:hypothetical protein